MGANMGRKIFIKRRTTMDPEFIEHMKKIVIGSESKIKDSSIYLGLYSKDFAKDPAPLLQLALAIVLDKPIFIIALEDELIPETLEHIAVTVQRVHGRNPEEMSRAVAEIHRVMDTIL